MSKQNFLIKDKVTIKIISKEKNQNCDKKINNSLQKKEQIIKE